MVALSKSARARAKAALAWSTPNRVAVATVGALAVAGIAVAAYAILKRPADIHNTQAAFKPEHKRKIHYTDWPIYRYDAARTSYLPTKRVKPPFRKIWQFQAYELTEFPPVFAKGALYGQNNDGLFYAIDADTGKPRWKRQLGTLNASSPAYYKGRLYAVDLAPPQVTAMKASNGRSVWHKPLPGPSESSPIVAAGKVILGSQDGHLWAFDAKNGKQVWSTALGGAVKAAPALYKGVLYVGDYGGHMSAVRLSNGSIKWQSGSQGGSFGTSGEFYSTPAVAFGRVYSGNNDGRVYSFETSDGSIAWSHSTGDWVYGSPAVADVPRGRPTVYIGSYDQNFYALDARTGNTIWAHPTPGRISGGATVVGDVVYYSDFDTTSSYGLDVHDGKLVWMATTGAYNPVISDGRRIFLTGYSSVSGLKPVPKKKEKKATAAKQKAAKGK
jgi:outer membrane protein assembly factor BamB